MQAEVNIKNAQIQHQAIEIQEKEAEIYRLQRELKYVLFRSNVVNTSVG